MWNCALFEGVRNDGVAGAGPHLSRQNLQLPTTVRSTEPVAPPMIWVAITRQK